ncbi:MAG: transketolase [Candidatus Woesearchaeota archaeon]|nr:MAG: transketolase [Candidatus Woesearchaeota archaeon]
MKHIQSIQDFAKLVRILSLQSIHLAGSGHPGGSLDAAEVFAAIYYARSKEKIEVVLSAGHLAPAWYASLYLTGEVTRHQMRSLRKLGSKLQGHPERGTLPSILNTSGPLGQGASFGVGRALGTKKTVLVITSDGEHQEGQTWEAIMSAAQFGCSNLVFLVLHNNMQIDGHVTNIMNVESLAEKYAAFHWEVQSVEGNKPLLVQKKLQKLITSQSKKPRVLICHTLAGKGVSFMENNPLWHGKSLSDKELQCALGELSAQKMKENYPGVLL